MDALAPIIGSLAIIVMVLRAVTFFKALSY